MKYFYHTLILYVSLFLPGTSGCAASVDTQQQTAEAEVTWKGHLKHFGKGKYFYIFIS